MLLESLASVGVCIDHRCADDRCSRRFTQVPGCIELGACFRPIVNQKHAGGTVEGIHNQVQ